MHTILSHILFPSSLDGKKAGLYVRGESILMDETGLTISSGDFFDLNTYFNSFSYDYFQEKTDMKDISLRVSLLGTGIH